MKAIISVPNFEGRYEFEVTSLDELERVTIAYDSIDLDYFIYYVKEN